MHVRKSSVVAILSLLLIAACAPLSKHVRPPEATEITLALKRIPAPTAIPDASIVDSGLVYGEPCKAPCWFGMIPGKTTVEEIQAMMPRLSVLESPYDFTHDEGDIPFVIQTRSDITAHMSIRLEINRDKKILQAIDSSPLTFDYSLGQLIAQFGEPDIVVDTDPKAAERSCDEWMPSDRKSLTAATLSRILYPQQGLLFVIRVPIDGNNLLCPEMLVHRFCYFAPVALQDALINGRLADLCEDDLLEHITEKNLIKWRGYSGGY